MPSEKGYKSGKGGKSDRVGPDLSVGNHQSPEGSGYKKPGKVGKSDIISVAATDKSEAEGHKN